MSGYCPDCGNQHCVCNDAKMSTPHPRPQARIRTPRRTARTRRSGQGRMSKKNPRLCGPARQTAQPETPRPYDAEALVYQFCQQHTPLCVCQLRGLSALHPTAYDKLLSGQATIDTGLSKTALAVILIAVSAAFLCFVSGLFLCLAVVTWFCL